MDKNISLPQVEGSTFGTYQTTTKVNGVQSRFTPNVDAIPSAEAESSGYQKTTNEIDYNPSERDILKATSDGPISLDNYSASNTDGFNTYFDTNVDILQASSASGNEGAQFGEYKTTTKVNGVQSIYTPSIDAKPSDENTNTTQLLGQTVANTTTNFNLGGFDFGSTNDANQSETGVTLGNLQNNTKTDNLGFDQFGASVDALQSANNATDFDFDSYLKNLKKQVGQNASSSSNYVISAGSTVDNLGQNNDDTTTSLDLTAITANIPGIDITKDLKTTTTTTVTKTTSTVNTPSAQQKYDTTDYSSGSPILDSIPYVTSNLQLAPKNDTNALLNEYRTTLRQQSLKTPTLSMPTTEQTIQTTTNYQSPLDIQTFTQTSPVKYENLSPVETTYTTMPTTVTNKFTTSNVGNSAEFGEYKTTTKIGGVQSQFMPDIDSNPAVNIPMTVSSLPPVETTYTTMPTPVPNTFTTPNVGSSAEFGEYKTTTKIGGVQSQFMPDIDSLPTPTFTQNTIVTPPILPPPAPITQSITVKVPTQQTVIVPKVKQVYIPSTNKIYVRRPPVTSSVTVPVTTSYTQSTIVPSPAPIPTVLPRPGPTVQMVGRPQPTLVSVPPIVANPPTIPVSNSIVTVKPPVVPVPPNNSVLIANAPGNRIIAPQTRLLNVPYSQSSIPVVTPTTTTVPYSQASIPVVPPRVATTVPYSQASIPVVPPRVATTVPYSQASIPVLPPTTTTVPYSQASIPVVPPRVATTVPYSQASIPVVPAATTAVPVVPTTATTVPVVRSPTTAAVPVVPTTASTVPVVRPPTTAAVPVVPTTATTVPVVPTTATTVPVVPPTTTVPVVPPTAATVPYSQASIPVVQPTAATVPYSQASIPVVQPTAATVPYNQASIPVVQPTALPVQTPLPVIRQPLIQTPGAIQNINTMGNVNYPGVGMNRPNVYNASTYRNNLARNRFRNVNRNNVMGNMGAPSQYSTRTYNARKL